MEYILSHFKPPVKENPPLGVAGWELSTQNFLVRTHVKNLNIPPLHNFATFLLI